MVCAVVVSACALVVSACGASGGGGATAASDSSAPLKFANCMRSHGVPNFPDPGAGGAEKLVAGSGLDPQSPSFRAASKACGRLAPVGAPVQISERQKLAALAFAKCMRAHGQPNFPDPTSGPPTGATLVLALRGMVFAVGPGVDPRSPQFIRSAAACGVNLPSGPPRSQ